MDGLDQVTLVLLFLLVVVALLFPLTDGRSPGRDRHERRDDEAGGGESKRR
nr:hypothetical protein [Herbaspirillum sp. ASV7]